VSIDSTPWLYEDLRGADWPTPRHYGTSSNVSRRRWSTRSLSRGCREFITTSSATLRGHEENRWVGRVVRTTLFHFQSSRRIQRFAGRNVRK